MIKRITVTAALTLVGVAAALAWAYAGQTRTNNRASNMAQNRTALNAMDQKFMTRAAAGGMFEVQSSQLALQQASNPEVKQFAQEMVNDHTKANDQLKQIAGNMNVTLPTATDASHKGIINKLTRLHGAAFDKAYMRAQVTAHKATVALFRTEEKRGSDPAVKGFAQQTLPTLITHYNHARQVWSTLNAASFHRTRRHMRSHTY
ncbi:MAG TPA: DUF4142 domain-containing protein [Chthonomonadaceae bacterium]|nr:DUF4142 domain-containing protein [Chthonomonadaceae bacterium]